MVSHHQKWINKLIIHFITMTLWWHLKSPASPLFAQLLVQAQIKENIKAPRHWLFCVESTGDRWIPHKRPVTRKMFSLDDVIMCKPFFLQFQIHNIKPVLNHAQIGFKLFLTRLINFTRLWHLLVYIYTFNRHLQDGLDQPRKKKKYTC